MKQRFLELKMVRGLCIVSWVAVLSLMIDPSLKAANAESLKTAIVGHVDHFAFRAVERRSNNVLRVLLQDGLAPDQCASDGTTLLMYAAMHGDAEGVRLLLEAGADPNASNEVGHTALILGAGDFEKVKLLVEAGAVIEVKTKQGMSPLSAAAGHGEGANSVEYLLQKGADPSAEGGGFWGMGALGVAAYTGNLNSVKAVVRHLGDSAQLVDDLRMALHGGTDQGHREIVEFLFDTATQNGSDLGFLGDRLSEALAHSNPEMARKLIHHGAKPTDVFSVAYSDIELDSILSEFLQHDVDVNQRTWRNHTALDFARLRGHKRVTELLLAAGAQSGRRAKEKEIPNRGIRLNDNNAADVVTHSVKRGLSLLLRSSDRFMQNRESCTSCHHQDLPAIAATLARARGIKVAEDSLIRIARRQVERWHSTLSYPFEGKVLNPDPTKTIGYLLWARSVQGLPLGPITKGLVLQLAARQLTDGSWHGHGPRMPMQDGVHMATALGLRALKMYPLDGRRGEFEIRIRRAQRWLEDNPAQILTHQAFRLLGLAWAASDDDILRQGIMVLVGSQNIDGGWSQLENLDSDAWATGLALMALHAAGLETNDPVYRRGMEFLVNTQFEDGSWYVRSRSRPSQPHFDSHFPFGWDQWISAAGSSLACASLSLALEAMQTSVLPIESEEMVLQSPKGAEALANESDEKQFEFSGVRTVDFMTDIRPLLERSCLECHSGDEPEGYFKVINRAAMIRGGESGVSTFEPGHGSESQLIRHLNGMVEDMEMPPLSKRRIYPPLSPEQIKLITIWIDEGAEWPEEGDFSEE